MSTNAKTVTPAASPTILTLSEADRLDVAIVIRELEEARDHARRAQSPDYTDGMNTEFQRRADAIDRFLRKLRPTTLPDRTVAANEA